MFSDNGAPTGYGQNQPGTDPPQNRPSAPNGRPPTGGGEALQTAIVGPAQYSPDPGFMAWRQGGQPANPYQMQSDVIMNGQPWQQGISGTMTPAASPMQLPSHQQPGRIHTMAPPSAEGGMTPTSPAATGQLAPPNADAFAKPQGNWADPNFRTQAFQQGIKAARGSDANDTDLNYWHSKWDELDARGQQLNDPDYAWKRLLGMDAGGADAARFGPYAGGSAQPRTPNPALQSAISGQPPPQQSQPQTTDSSAFIRSLLQQSGAPQF